MSAAETETEATEGRNTGSTPAGSEPKSPSAHIKKLTRTLSWDTTSSTATWHAGSSALFKATVHEEDPPAHFESSLCTPAFVLKISQWTLCILCTGLFYEGSSLIYDFKQQLFPYVAYWTYMMITGVIIISYLLGHKMREVLIRLYNIIGAIMFLVAAVMILKVIHNKWEIWMKPMESLQATNQTHVPNQRLKMARILLTQSIMCLLNSILYFTDTAYSLYLSYKSVTFYLHST